MEGLHWILVVSKEKEISVEKQYDMGEVRMRAGLREERQAVGPPVTGQKDKKNTHEPKNYSSMSFFTFLVSYLRESLDGHFLSETTFPT